MTPDTLMALYLLNPFTVASCIRCARGRLRPGASCDGWNEVLTGGTANKRLISTGKGVSCFANGTTPADQLHARELRLSNCIGLVREASGTR